jgi:Fe-S-cluster-containing dehydrogenase component
MRIDDLSATRYTTIVRRPGSRFVRVQCRHCRQPACVSVCLVGAMQKTPEGPVVYDPDRCIGCRYCMMACPYGIPRYDWDNQPTAQVHPVLRAPGAGPGAGVRGGLPDEGDHLRRAGRPGR